MARQQGWSKRRKARTAQQRNRPPLAAHRAFAPLLGIWGALLGGLIVSVLPATLVGMALRGTVIGTWDKPILASLAAALLGGGLFVFAADRHSRARREAEGASLVKAAAPSMHPIDPARDLGTKSLDDPLGAMPFSTPAWRDADLDMPAGKPANAPSAAQMVEPAAAPIELDLSEFAELPGRNAVWVEEASEPVAASPVAPASAPPPALHAVPPPEPGTAALGRLRAIALNELSMAEMVERFAAALHEHRAAPPVRGPATSEFAAREAALADALKALSGLSGGALVRGAAENREDPLHTALSQLQAQRGAA